jgi:hypothetical protein
VAIPARAAEVRKMVYLKDGNWQIRVVQELGRYRSQSVCLSWFSRASNVSGFRGVSQPLVRRRILLAGERFPVCN